MVTRSLRGASVAVADDSADAVTIPLCSRRSEFAVVVLPFGACRDGFDRVPVLDELTFCDAEQPVERRVHPARKPSLTESTNDPSARTRWRRSYSTMGRSPDTALSSAFSASARLCVRGFHDVFNIDECKLERRSVLLDGETLRQPAEHGNRNAVLNLEVE